MTLASTLEERRHELRKTQIVMIDGKLTSNDHSVEAGRSARAYEDGYWGFAAGADGRAPEQLRDQALRNARARARFGARPALPLPGAASQHRQAVAGRPAAPAAELIDRLTAAHALCLSQCEGLASVRLLASEEEHLKDVSTSHGSAVHNRIRRAMVYIALTSTDDEGRPIEVWERFSAKGSLDDIDLSTDALRARLAVANGHLQAKRHAVAARGGLHTVVMGPLLTGILAHEAMGHPCEADIVLGGSIAGDLLGQRIASPLVSMVDVAHTWRGSEVMMPVYTDDEGTPAADAVLIDRGVLKGFMHSRETAARLGMAPTGSARAYGPGDEPLVRMRNTVILPGEQTVQQLIEGVDEGYYLVATANGQADTTTEFMFGVTLGYEIKDGRLGRAIRDTTLSGSALKVLASVDGVADDLEWEATGYCGKKQPMVVSSGGPTLRAKAQLGGA
jgi:TldD protein